MKAGWMEKNRAHEKMLKFRVGKCKLRLNRRFFRLRFMGVLEMSYREDSSPDWQRPHRYRGQLVTRRREGVLELGRAN